MQEKESNTRANCDLEKYRKQTENEKSESSWNHFEERRGFEVQSNLGRVWNLEKCKKIWHVQISINYRFISDSFRSKL